MPKFNSFFQLVVVALTQGGPPQLYLPSFLVLFCLNSAGH